MSAKILIVDDSTFARKRLRQILESLHCTVEEAGDGETALERVALGNPDLVILDMVMPGIGGAEALAQLQALRPALPILFATADTQQVTANDVRKGGAKGLLNKPMKPDEVKAAVAKVLAGGHAWPEPL